MNTTARRWLARASFALMLAAVALVLAVAGWRSLALVAFNVIGVCAVLAGAYWFLANRGVLRALALVLMVAAPVLILVTFALHSLLWVAVVAVALMVLATGTAKTALSADGQDGGSRAEPGGPPATAVPDHEPEVGWGQGIKFGLKQKAEKLGAQVALLEGPGSWTWPRWPTRRWPMAPTCSVWPEGTEPRRWWPGSPPSTAFPFW